MDRAHPSKHEGGGMKPPPAPSALPSFGEAQKVWARIGCLSFGGPAAQIALMHRELVDQRRWVGEQRFLQALNFCTLLPGPEAQQLATYLGWLMHGVKGGLSAGLLFILPGAAVMLVLSLMYVTLGTLPLVAALFFGLKAAVLVLVVEALLRISRRALKGLPAYALAAAAFIALYAFRMPFPAVVLAAALIGFVLPGHFSAGGHGSAQDGGEPAALDQAIVADPDHVARLAPAARRAGLVAAVLWLWPVALLYAHGGVFGEVALFFSKMAVVTFGGAYAVLAWVAQEAVEVQGWLSAGQMLDGLGLAETTPGPLILVLQFVGFLAGFQAHGIAGGIAAGGLALFVTFAPSFVWIFLGAPFVERLQNRPALAGALAAITAAVVGVVLNLALWFGLRVLFGGIYELAIGPARIDLPVPASLDWRAATIAAVALVALFRLRLGVVPTLGIAAGLGVVLTGWA
jgi:chromate transporter